MSELDFEKARSDVRYFVRALGAGLTEWQTAAMKLDTRLTAIVAGRQLGKSLVLAWLALWWSVTRPGSHVLIVSSSEDGARRLLATIRRLAVGSPLLAGSVVDELAGLVTLSTGSQIRSVPASERAIRGWTVDLLLLDEAALMPDDLIVSAALPTVAARPDGRVVIASSALTASGAFYDIAERGRIGDEHVRTFRWVAKVAGGAEDAPWISPSSVEAARAAMSEVRFAAEYMAVWGGTGDAWIPRAALERVICDLPLLTLEGTSGPARLSGGIDWGRRVDRCAILLVARSPGAPRSQFRVVCAHRAPQGQPGFEFIEEVCGSPAHFDTLTAERNGLGEGYCERLLPALRARPQEVGGGRPARGHVVVSTDRFEALLEGRKRRSAWDRPGARPFQTTKVLVHVTSQSKMAAYSAARILIDREALLIPRAAEDLIRELLLLRVSLTASGTDRIEAGSGHDDLADALTLALGPYQREGRWRCRLADLADRRAPEPDFDCDGDPGAFQSVAGPEVTTSNRDRRPEPIRIGDYVVNPHPERTTA